MTNPNRHPEGITRPEFLGRVDTSLAELTNKQRKTLWRAKQIYLLRRNPTGTHRQMIDTRPLWFRSLSILGAAIGGGAFLALVFGAVYFLEI